MQCLKADCRRLIFFASSAHRPTQFRNGEALFFSKIVIKLESSAKYTFILFTQQITGLITMFFELMILDVRKPILTLMRRISRLILSVKSLGNKRKILKSNVSILILNVSLMIRSCVILLCLLHIIASTRQYMNYNMSSETWIGSFGNFANPTLLFCDEKQMNFNRTIGI